MRDKLTYSNVMATIAVFLSVGAGAYAAGIGRNDVKSRHIADGTIKSRDVHDRILKGRDIREETLTSKEIREDRLNVSQFAKVGGNGSFCSPNSSAFVTCNTVTLGGEQVSQLLIVATGGQESVGSPARGPCRLTLDGSPLAGSEVFPGERLNANTGAFAQNGFAITQVSERLGRGTHTVQLQCNRDASGGGIRLSTDLSVLLLDAI